MKMTYSGALWGTILKVKMPTKKPQNYFFVFIGQPATI